MPRSRSPQASDRPQAGGGIRIARVLTRLALGGPSRQVLASDLELARRGHSVRLFVGDPEPGEGDLRELFQRLGLEVVSIPGLRRRPTPWADARAGWALRRELRAFGPDLVHTHASKAGTLGRLAARRCGLPAVHTFHGHVLEGYFPARVSRALVRVEQRLARHTARVLTVAHATADDLVRLGVCGEEQITVVPPGIQTEPFLGLRARSHQLRRLVGAGEDDLLVGVVGRLVPVKRPELALEVFELLAQRHARMHLVFVGDGPGFAGLARRVRGGSEAVRARVHLVGAQENMVSVMSDLDAVLLTSRSEGTPICLLEAGAAGLPVIASAVGGVEEIVAHERTGWLGESVDEWAYGLDQLLSDARMREGMGQRARVRIAARHGASGLADRLEAVYRAVLEERSA
jgi:glycosyltransferase involved in cell wall biosynthesis